MLVMPSYYEGFGLPVLEALTLGCPVICSDIPVFHELFEDHVTFFDLNSKEDLRNKIKMHLKGEQLPKVDMKSLGEKYSYSSGAKKILSIISE